jgi:RND family efflux transporter MFP subunit
VNGTIYPAAGQLAEVAAPVSGLLLAEANLRAPSAGDPVRQGQTLAVIAPAPGNHSYAEAKARVERLRREVDRLERLFDAEAIPEQRLIEARHDLEVADAAFQAMGGSSDDGYNYPVRAPITGVVHARRMVPGARAEAGDRLFTIVNPSVVWLRLHLPARDAARADAIREVVFTVEGGDETFRTRRVISVGSVLDPATRTLPVTLAVDNSDRRLKVGLFAEGFALVGGETEGVALPNDAIQREDGQAVTYVQTEGESFERRPLALGATDGSYTLVERGVAAGEYVVTKGAYQVYLASLNTSEISDHGHPH